MDVTVDKGANLNWIEKIKIQQELLPTEAGSWIPSKTRVLVNIGELSENMAGFLAKFYTSTKDIIVNAYTTIDDKAVGLEDIDRTNTNTIRIWSKTNNEDVRLVIIG